MDGLRGVKRDAWEGGHRVPFLARWSGHTPRGAVSNETICHVDLMATVAALVGGRLPDNAGEDSVNVLPALLGEKRGHPLREATVLHSCSGKFAIRQGGWVLIDAASADDNQEPAWFKAERGYLPNQFPGELYNLYDDLIERHNAYGEKPDIVQRLKTLLEKYKADGRSTPGVHQHNDVAGAPAEVGKKPPPGQQTASHSGRDQAMRITRVLTTFSVVALAGGTLALLLGFPRETQAAQPAAATEDCSFCKEVLILHHSHVDVGYTHPQSMYWELQKDYLSAALDMLDRTENWPDDLSRPRWTAEATAPVLRWLETATPTDVARLKKHLRSGHFGISGFEYNTTPLSSAEGLARQLYPVRMLREKLGADIRTVNQHDVTGIPWSAVDLLLDSKIELLIMGINLHLSGTPGPRPAVYRWKGPSGRELLVMNGEHTACSTSGATPTLATSILSRPACTSTCGT